MYHMYNMYDMYDRYGMYAMLCIRGIVCITCIICIARMLLFQLPLVSIPTSSCAYVERSLHSCLLAHADLFRMLLSGT